MIALRSFSSTISSTPGTRAGPSLTRPVGSHRYRRGKPSLGAAINLAISVGRLSEFLKAPILVFNPPPLTYKNRTQTAAWTVKVLPSPGEKLPEKLSVEVTIDNGVEKPMVFKGEPAGAGSFRVKVTPVSHEPSQKVDIAVRFPNGQVVQDQVLDRYVTVGRQKLLLSDLRELVGGTPPRAITRRSEVVIGPIVGLGKSAN